MPTWQSSSIKDLRDCFARYIRSQRQCDTDSEAGVQYILDLLDGIFWKCVNVIVSESDDSSKLKIATFTAVN
jgi:hypothetical protein